MPPDGSITDYKKTMIRFTRGHQIFDEVFTPAQMQGVLDKLAAADFDRTKAGARHVLRVPVVRDLAGDVRLRQIACGFLGPTAAPFRATLFDKSKRANWLVAWHQDTFLPLHERNDPIEWGPWSTKAGVLYAHAPEWALERVVALRVHLDDSRATNGPLRVLPDTHRAGVLTVAQIDHLARTLSPVECTAASGSVVAMRPLTVHASSKAISEQPRRVLHIEYAADVELAPGIRLAVDG
jgi:hypothetical protein